jgi:hypothetical protein
VQGDNVLFPFYADLISVIWEKSALRRRGGYDNAGNNVFISQAQGDNVPATEREEATRTPDEEPSYK